MMIGDIDPRIDRDPREPEQPPPVEDPEDRTPDEPVEDPPALPRGEPERRDPPPGEPAWRDPDGGPPQETLNPGPSLR